MQLHYLTLKRQTDYLKTRIIGAQILDSFTQVKNEWLLHLQLPGGDQTFLQLSSHPRFPFIILNESIKKQKLSTAVMEQLLNAEISDLRIISGERIIRMEFESAGFHLMIHLFSTNSNFLIVENNRIVNSFKKSKNLMQQGYAVPETTQADITSLSKSQFEKVLKENAEKPLAASLKNNFYHLNKTIVAEVFFRLGISHKILIKDVKDDQINQLHSITLDFLRVCEKDEPRIYFKNNLPEVFSLTHLEHLSAAEEQLFDDINSALRIFNFQNLKFQGLIPKKQQYLKAIRQRIEYLEKTLKNLESRENRSSKKEYYQKIGELILAQPRVIKKGENTAELIDYYNPQTPVIKISINPKLNVQENAEAFFRKAKDFERKQQERFKRAKEIRGQLSELNQMEKNVEAVDSFRQLEKIELKLKSQNLLQKNEAEAKQSRLPYKRITFKDWEIWVGRNARDNDALTFKHAHKEDWWLHAQGYSGSHVVIRNPQRRKDIPPGILQHAARLAVTNSEARHASYVPVVYTKVKHVRKPRKSLPGTVIPAQTKTIYADPILG